MTHTFKFLLICLLSCLTVAAPLHADDEPLQATLNRVYKEWCDALRVKSLDAWKRCTTTYRQALTRNLIISEGQEYPEALFNLPVTPPDVFRLKLLEARAVGPTAQLIYFGKVDLGVGVPPEKLPDNLLALKFFQENGQWKFDSTKFINLNSAPDIRDASAKGSPEFLNHPPFIPPGVLPPVPKPCGKPERIGALRIEAMGYEVTAHMNGYVYPTVIDNATQEVIIGGLSRGDNELTLDIKALPVPHGEERVLEVQAMMADRVPERPMTRVFDWKPRYHPAEPQVRLNVSLNNVTMKGI